MRVLRLAPVFPSSTPDPVSAASILFCNTTQIRDVAVQEPHDTDHTAVYKPRVRLGLCACFVLKEKNVFSPKIISLYFLSGKTEFHSKQIPVSL